MSAHDLIVMMGLVLAASIGTQLLAEHLRLPAILPLLGVGVLLGPELLGFVQPDALGIGLQVLIPLMVAIIVFEGGMVLDLGYLRQVSPIVRNLITVGCLVTWLLAALAANLLVDLPWPLALLFGALVSVTGPTVINPLLRRAAVTQRLKTILMAEGVLIDAVGVVLSVVVLEALLSGVSVVDGALTWLIRVGGGTLLGIGCGWLLGRGLRFIGRRYSAELTRLTALGGALAIYTLGELLSAEMGIAAAAAAGVMVGNMRFPHEREVHHFKGDLTTIGIGVIFVLLAARLRFADLLALGWGGVFTVAALILVVRPACVFISALGTRVPAREQLFLAAVGPRGIVAASFATFAALRLEAAGYAGSQTLVGLVFLVILGTVVIQSFSTPWVARLLGVRPMLTLIVGAEELGRELAKHLQTQGEEVVLIDRDPDSVAAAREEGLVAILGDATQEAVLRRAGIERTHAVVATTSSDKANLIVCQLARSRYGISDLVARANDGSNLRMFAELGIRAMSPTAAAVMVLDNLLRRPSTLRLMTDLDSGKDVREVTLQNPALAGRVLKEVRLDGDVLIAMVRRDKQLFVPHGDTAMALGDQLTLLGSAEDVAAVGELFERQGEGLRRRGAPLAGDARPEEAG